MGFEFDYTNVQGPDEIKCPVNVGKMLFSMLPTPLTMRKGGRVYLRNVTPLTIGFVARYGNSEGIFRVVTSEGLKDPEHLRVFNLITANAQHGGKAAEMALEFLNNTLT